jgi:hypothetical protein
VDDANMQRSKEGKKKQKRKEKVSRECDGKYASKCEGEDQVKAKENAMINAQLWWEDTRGPRPLS